MEPCPVQFRLPLELPLIYSVKKRVIRTLNPETAATILSAINEMLNGNTKKELNQQYVVKFFRAIARDTHWLRKYQKEALKIVQAVTICYFFTTDEKIEIKITKIFIDYIGNIKGILANDIDLVVDQNKVPFKALLLVVHSKYFERMLKGPFADGVKFRTCLLLGSKPPYSILQECTTKTLTSLRVLLEEGDSKEIKSLNAHELNQLFQYIEMTQCGSYVFPKLEKLLCEHLLEKPLKAFEYIEYNDDPYPLPNLKREIQRIILKEINVDQAVEGIKERKIRYREKVFEGNEVREDCLDWFLENIPYIFAKLKHKIPSFNSSKSRKVEFLQKFVEIGSFFRKLTQSKSISKLTQEELLWVLDKVSDQITELDLSKSQFAGGDTLQKFQHLKVLKINYAFKMVKINITKCSALKIIDFIGCYALREIKLSDQVIEDDHFFEEFKLDSDFSPYETSIDYANTYDNSLCLIFRKKGNYFY